MHRILVALDVPTLAQAESLVEQLGSHVGGFKVGLELLTAAGAPQVVERLRGNGRPLFFDGKFKDIPHTVAGATRAVARLGVAMLNVHALGGVAMMQAAVTAAEEGARLGGWSRPKVLAVTILTSCTPETLQTVGFTEVHGPDDLERLVVLLARRACEAGCDGVVASPREIAAIRAACGKNFLIVTPGVRPTWAVWNVKSRTCGVEGGTQQALPVGGASSGFAAARSKTEGFAESTTRAPVIDDQRRFTTPREAIDAGADYLVIGRPITNPPAEIGPPIAAAQRILAEIAVC